MNYRFYMALFIASMIGCYWTDNYLASLVSAVASYSFYLLNETYQETHAKELHERYLAGFKDGEKEEQDQQLAEEGEKHDN